MALLNQSIQAYGQLGKFLETLRAGTAPSSFTREFLKDIGFKSSNHHQFIPLLKGLGFLTPDGTPTDRYRQFLDGSRWRKVLAEAVREAYGDIFVIKAKPTNSDLQTAPEVDKTEVTPITNATINGVEIASPPVNATLGLHYNIQIHLPATKDVEVYNAIFKSLRDHLIE